jgi:uncharacterized membrane protein YfhO
MPVYEIVSIVVIIIGLIALIVYELFYDSPKDKWVAVILIVLTISMIGILAGENSQTKYAPKEFPAKEYDLGYKVIEEGSQRDTIYTLTRKRENNV